MSNICNTLSIKYAFNLKNMKKIIIVRHAKSSWDEHFNDHDRSLAVRGLKDAELVSLKFKELKEIPDLVISSTAKRAKMTADIFKKNLNLNSINLNKTN